jgi:hypothetical protein
MESPARICIGAIINGKQYGNIVNIDDYIKQTPFGFALSNNYPNPFNPSTKIRYEIPAAEKVSIKIYDVLGNEIKTLVDEFKDAGYYEVDFSAVGGADNLSSGVYFYRIVSGSFSETKKMVLMR